MGWYERWITMPFGNGTKFLDTKPIVPSSWSDSVIGDAYLPIPRRQASVINAYEKKLGYGARCMLKLPHLLRPIRRKLLIHININWR